jgi:hypothetical protein
MKKALKITLLLLLGILISTGPVGYTLAQGIPGAVVSSRSSFNWSGYAATGGAYTSVTGSWIVPTVSPENEDIAVDATWVGIGGMLHKDLIQVGTAGIVVDGRVTYEAWYELLPDVSKPLPIEVRAGDKITAGVTETSPDTWSIFIRNDTTGKNHQLTVPYQSSRSSAEWVEEMASNLNGDFVPITNFGKVTFWYGSTIKNGRAMTIAEANAKPVTMINEKSVPLAVPSILSNNGASFTVTRTNTPATSNVVAYERSIPTEPRIRITRDGSNLVIRFVQKISIEKAAVINS